MHFIIHQWTGSGPGDGTEGPKAGVGEAGASAGRAEEEKQREEEEEDEEEDMEEPDEATLGRMSSKQRRLFEIRLKMNKVGW